MMSDWIGVAEDVPGDGTCMFHAVAKQIGVKDGYIVRDFVADYITRHSDAVLNGAPLHDWIAWELGISPQEYVQRLRGRMWGGALEMTMLAAALRTSIFVYIPQGPTQCIRATDVRPDLTLPAEALHAALVPRYVCLLYVGRSHYMCLRATRQKLLR